MNDSANNWSKKALDEFATKNPSQEGLLRKLETFTNNLAQEKEMTSAEIKKLSQDLIKKSIGEEDEEDKKSED